MTALARTARDSRDWATAAEHYKAALALSPSRAAIWVQYGHALKESGDLDGAGVAYDRALALAPDVADTHLQIGHLLKLKNRIDDAATAYLRAAELDPNLHHAFNELRALMGRGITIDTDRLRTVMTGNSSRPTQALRVLTPRPTLEDARGLLEQQLKVLERSDADHDPSVLEMMAAIRRGIEASQTLASSATAGDPSVAVHLVFDISDLVSYFHHARLPTGIQRVQIEVISALLTDPVKGVGVAICSFSQGRDHWVDVSPDLFLSLSELALLSGDTTDRVWIAALDEMALALDLGGSFVFERGAHLINLGTSWWLQNYFLKVRQAKEQFAIQYIPFVHDMIPVMTPEHCTVPLTQDFISWALGVFSHADHFLTNSKASRADLIAVGATLGHVIPEENVHVVTLNADFRKPVTATPIPDTMARYGLKDGGYVLFVSTIESRKNHLNSFKAWLSLIEKHGAARVPRLVCVGNRGWLNDAVFEKLATSPELRSKVLMVSGVSDPDLVNLYRACAFTLYPSTYEGWGLPVTESLCYGKVPLMSDSSSLPEAGGDFGIYFKVGDQEELIAQLERLMFDLPFRRQLETRIAAEYSPRPWRDLGVEIAEQIAAWFPSDEPHDDVASIVGCPTLGRYYWLKRVDDVSIRQGMISSEIFRSGDGWWQPDDWGTWTKLKGGTLKLGLDDASGPLRLFIGLWGLGNTELDFTITVAGTETHVGRLHRAERRWIAIDVDEDSYDTSELVIHVKGNATDNFADNTGGVDTRVASVGVVGFMICRQDDVISRQNLLEAVQFRQLPELARQYS